MLGVLLALCAAASWGTDAVLARQGLRRMPPAFGTLVSLCASVVGALAVAAGILLYEVRRQLNAEHGARNAEQET